MSIEPIDFAAAVAALEAELGQLRVPIAEICREANVNIGTVRLWRFRTPHSVEIFNRVVAVVKRRQSEQTNGEASDYLRETKLMRQDEISASY